VIGGHDDMLVFVCVGGGHTAVGQMLLFSALLEIVIIARGKQNGT